MAVLGMNAAGRLTLINRAAEEMSGYGAEEALGREVADLFVPPELRDAFQAGLARLQETGESAILGRRLDFTAQRADGTTLPVAVTVTRLPGGGADSFAAFVRDVSDEKRAAAAQLLRARTAELLETGSDYEGTLRGAAGLPVPELADWCWLDLPDPRGRIRTAVDSRAGRRPAYGRIPSSAEAAAQANAPGLREVIGSSRPARHPAVTGRILARYAHSKAHLEQMESAGVTSLMVVPMRAGRRTLGSMAFASTRPERCYVESDLELALEIAHRCGTAIDNARLYEERARTAATLMASLRPPAIPDLAGWATATMYEPAGRTDEVGGDFYDIFATRDGWMLVIGDVVGHGPPAAALTSLARYSIRAAGTLTGRAAPALEHLNDQLRQDGRLALLSAVCLLLREAGGEATATVAVAGHPRPVLVRDGRPEVVGRTSLVLGVADDIGYVEDRIPIRDNDCLVLYTDGVIDVVGETERFGEDRLLRALAGEAASPEIRLQRLRDELASFQAGAQRDDIAVLAVQRTRVASAGEQVFDARHVPS
jgi:PAS domain S-box-containing protein